MKPTLEIFIDDSFRSFGLLGGDVTYDTQIPYPV